MNYAINILEMNVSFMRSWSWNTFLIIIKNIPTWGRNICILNLLKNLNHPNESILPRGS